MTKDLKVGDRVAVYGGLVYTKQSANLSGAKGTVKRIEPSNTSLPNFLWVEFDKSIRHAEFSDGSAYVHPNQCRRLKKKEKTKGVVVTKEKLGEVWDKACVPIGCMTWRNSVAFAEICKELGLA